MNDPLVSIVVPTKDRARLLPNVLASLLTQTCTRGGFEIIVVDNGSRDGTGEYLRDIASRSNGVIRSRLEGRESVSYARNAGIIASRGTILAFVDDDVFVRPGWLAAATDILLRMPDVQYLGGPVRPLWESDPPHWLTRDHWPPLGAADYGTDQFEVPTARAVCLISANLFVRRAALDRVGLFHPMFRRCQDRELMLRLWAAGLNGLYSPDVIADTLVPVERLTRTYHRRWHEMHGTYLARMPLRERRCNDNCVVEPSTHARFFLGAPLFEYRSLAEHLARYAQSSLMLRATKRSSTNCGCGARSRFSLLPAVSPGAARPRRTSRPAPNYTRVDRHRQLSDRQHNFGAAWLAFSHGRWHRRP